MAQTINPFHPKGNGRPAGIQRNGIRVRYWAMNGLPPWRFIGFPEGGDGPDMWQANGCWNESAKQSPYDLMVNA